MSDNKKMVAILLGKLTKKPSEDNQFKDSDAAMDPEGGDLDNNPPDECIAAAEQILKAIEMKDAKLLAQSLLDFDEIEDSYNKEDEDEESSSSPKY